MFCNGDKVVLVDDVWPPFVLTLYTALPAKDQVYVVRGSTVGVSYAQDGRQEGEICVYLVGITNPTSNVAPFRERGFNAERFRKLDELETIETNREFAEVGAGAEKEFATPNWHNANRESASCGLN